MFEEKKVLDISKYYIYFTMQSKIKEMSEQRRMAMMQTQKKTFTNYINSILIQVNYCFYLFLCKYRTIDRKAASSNVSILVVTC